MNVIDTLLGHAGKKNVADLNTELAPLLAPGETLQQAFGQIRDLIVFTDRRLILVNKQGVTAKKVEYRSIPYRAITMHALETAGHFELESQLRIWVSGQPSPIELALGRNSGASDIVAVLAQNTSK